MDFVDRHRRFERIPRAAGRHPLLVVPGVVEIPDDRRRGRRRLGVRGERVGLVEPRFRAARAQVVLVLRPRGHAGDEPFPHARGSVRREAVLARLPGVEVADDLHFFGIRRPDGEQDAVHSLLRGQVRAKLLVEAHVRPLAEQVDVVLAQAMGRQPLRFPPSSSLSPSSLRVLGSVVWRATDTKAVGDGPSVVDPLGNGGRAVGARRVE